MLYLSYNIDLVVDILYVNYTCISVYVYTRDILTVLARDFPNFVVEINMLL